MKKVLSLILISFFIQGCEADYTEKVTSNCADITYTNNIKEVFDNKCNKCHTKGYKDGDFTTYESIKPWVKNNELRFHTLVIKNMPPENEPQLTEEELGSIQCWLNSGAKE